MTNVNFTTDEELRAIAKKIVSRKKKVEVEKLVVKLEKKYFDKLKADQINICRYNEQQKVYYVKTIAKNDKDYYYFLSKTDFGEKLISDVDKALKKLAYELHNKVQNGYFD